MGGPIDGSFGSGQPMVIFVLYYAMALQVTTMRSSDKKNVEDA